MSPVRHARSLTGVSGRTGNRTEISWCFLVTWGGKVARVPWSAPGHGCVNIALLLGRDWWETVQGILVFLTLNFVSVGIKMDLLRPFHAEISCISISTVYQPAGKLSHLQVYACLCCGERSMVGFNNASIWVLSQTYVCVSLCLVLGYL